MSYRLEVKRLEPDEDTGISFIASLYPDPDASVYDYDCYSEEAIAAWRADEWHYVFMVVTAYLNGCEIASDSIGGMEYGMFRIDDGRFTFINPLDNEYVDDLRISALRQGIDHVKKMADMAKTWA